MASKVLASVQSLVIFPKLNKHYVLALDFLKSEIVKCSTERVQFDATGMILLKLLVPNLHVANDLDLLLMLPLVPNLHDIEFESAQYRELEKIFFIDTGRSRVLDKFKCFESGDHLHKDGFFNEEFFLYFSDILESPQNHDKQVKSFALNALLQTFYGQSSQEILNGPRDIVEMKSCIEAHLSTVSLRQNRSNELTRLIARVRCWCRSKLRGHNVESIFNIVRNIVLHFDKLLNLDDALQLQLVSDRTVLDDFFQYMLDVNMSITGMKNLLSLVHVINISIPLTGDNGSLVADFFQLFQEIMLLNRFAFTEFDKFEANLMDNLDKSSSTNTDKSIDSAVGHYMVSNASIKVIPMHHAQSSLKKIGGQIVDLWIKHKFRFEHYKTAVNFLESCRDLNVKGEKLKGERMQSMISVFQRFTRDLDSRLRDVIVPCFVATVAASQTQDEFRTNLEILKSHLKCLNFVPSEVLSILRENKEIVDKNRNDIAVQLLVPGKSISAEQNKEMVDKNRNDTAVQHVVPGKFIPAELLLALTFLKHQLQSSQLTTRVSARNLAELYDLPLRLSTMLSLSIDGVTDPRQTGGKVDGMVIFLGLTGSGKSTTINYLTGTDYFLKEYRSQYSLEEVPNQVRSATRVGFSAKSGTLYPHVIYGSNGVNLADCPGFEDNRESYTAAVSRFAVPLAVFYARQITAVAVTVEWNSCNPEASGRGVTLRNLSTILGNIFKEKLGALAEFALMIVVTKLPDLALKKTSERNREEFLGNVSDILNGQTDNRYQEIGRIEANLARISVQIRNRAAAGDPEIPADIKRRNDWQNNLNDLRNEKAMLELIASGKHRIFFMKPSEPESRKEFVEHINDLKEKKLFVPHSCFCFDPKSSDFRHVNVFVDEVVTKHKDMVSGLIRFHTESVTAEQKLQDQIGVIEQERILFDSILKGVSVGERDQMIQSNLNQNIDEQLNVIATLNKSNSEINDNIASEERNRSIIDGMPMVEHGSSITSSELNRFIAPISGKGFTKTWLSPWNWYTFPQSRKAPIPIEKIELSCTVDDVYGQGKQDYRVIVYQEPLSPNCDSIAKVVTVDRELGDVQALQVYHPIYPGVSLIKCNPSISQETGEFDITLCDLPNGIFKTCYVRKSEFCKSRSVRAFVLPKHLPDFRKKLANIEALINDFKFKLSRNEMDIDRANKIIADYRNRLAFLKGALGDNQKYKLDLLLNCMAKLDISALYVVENYFPQLSKEDCGWLRNVLNSRKLRFLPNVSDSFVDFWKSLGTTKAELEVHFQGCETSEFPLFEVEYLMSIVPVLKHLISCCNSTGLSIPSVCEILNGKAEKKLSDDSHFAVLRERQIGKYVSNFVHSHLLKDFSTNRRELNSVKILLELFKFNGSTEIDSDRWVFLENLCDIEERQLFSKNFKPLCLKDVKSVINKLNHLPDYKKKIIMNDLLPYGLKYVSLLDQSSISGINSIPEMIPTDKQMVSLIELYSGIDSAAVSKFIMDTKSEIISNGKALVPNILVFGLSGCGKSTVINHLLGVEYVNDDIQHNRLRGDFQYTETVYSSSHIALPKSTLLECENNPWNNVVLCECPHLYSKTNETMQLCGDLIIPLVLSEVSTVKSIILVIEYDDIFLQRGIRVGELISFVKSRFHLIPSETLHKSIFYVFTKVPACETKDTLCAKLQNLFLSDSKLDDDIDENSSIAQWTMRLVLLLVLNCDQVEIFYSTGSSFAEKFISKLLCAPEMKFSTSISCFENSSLRSILDGVSGLTTKYESLQQQICKRLKQLDENNANYITVIQRICTIMNSEISDTEDFSEDICLTGLSVSIASLQDQSDELQKTIDLLCGSEEINFASFEHPATNMWFYTCLKYSMLGFVNLATFAVGALPIPFLKTVMGGVGNLASIGLDHAFHGLIAVKIQHQIGFNDYRVECETLHGTVKTKETEVVDGQYDAVFYPSPYLIDMVNAEVSIHSEDFAKLRFFASKSDINAKEIAELRNRKSHLDAEIAAIRSIHIRNQEMLKAALEKNYQSVLNVFEEDVVLLRNVINDLLSNIGDNLKSLDDVWMEAIAEKRWFYFLQSLCQSMRKDVHDFIPNFAANFYEKVEEFRGRSSTDFSRILARSTMDEDSDVYSPSQSAKDTNGTSSRVQSVKLEAIDVHLPSELGDN